MNKFKKGDKVRIDWDQSKWPVIFTEMRLRIHPDMVLPKYRNGVFVEDILQGYCIVAYPNVKDGYNNWAWPISLIHKGSESIEDLFNEE